MPSPEFFRVQPMVAALKLIFDHWQPVALTHSLDTVSAINRVTALPIRSSEQIPPFRKSTVDGFAVRANDTFGASQALPAYLNVVGTVHMGEAPIMSIGQGEAVHIHTGGMLPDSANAVVMVEQTQMINDREIEAHKAVADGENIIQIGEDVIEGAAILEVFHRIRPQDIGGLLAVGITEIEVVQQPKVGILSCGDELVPPEKTPSRGQIRDINAYTLSALIQNAGGIPVHIGIAPDTFDDYLRHAQAGFSQTDMLLLTAGSSVSMRDLTRDIIQQLGEPGVLQHGIATKPGKPTILAVCDGKPVIGLPGNPVSALLIARQIIPALIAHFTQQPTQTPNTIRAVLSTNIASVTGREDWITVRLLDNDNQPVAEPIFGKSNLIFTLIQADGLVSVPINHGGLKKGTIVDVFPF